MICPLLLAGVFVSPSAHGGVEWEAPDCKEEDCAWWVSNNFVKNQQGEKGACAIQFMGRAAQRPR